MYKTVPIRVRFTDEEKAFWLNQCEHANSLINSALYHVRQTHYARLKQSGDAFTTYWRGDELRYGWKTYKCYTTYPELDKVLKDNPHYKAMAAQSAQQTLKSVGESIASYKALVNLYYQGEVDRPSLPKYRKKGGLAAVTFPRQALTYKDGCFYQSISRETKPELITDISLRLPEFIDSDWVKEVTVRPYFGELWIDWVIDDGKQLVEYNPNLDYTQAWSFDHGGTNWLTGVSTGGTSLIIDGRKLKAMNQGYCRLVAKYKIVLTITEEAYTSQASYLDGDSLHKHGEKPAGWKPSGQRVKRGLYKTAQGWLINADCNGAANILRKVATHLGLCLAEVGRGSLTLPQRYDLFTRLNKSYRKLCAVRLLDPGATSA